MIEDADLFDTDPEEVVVWEDLDEDDEELA